MAKVLKQTRYISLKISLAPNREYTNLHFDKESGKLLNIISYDLNKFSYTKLLLVLLESGNTEINWGTPIALDNSLENLLILEKIKIGEKELEKIKKILVKYSDDEIMKIIKKLFSIGIEDIVDFLERFERFTTQYIFINKKKVKKIALSYYPLQEINYLTLFFRLEEKELNLYKKLKISKDTKKDYIVGLLNDIYKELIKKDIMGLFDDKKENKFKNLHLTGKEINRISKLIIDTTRY